MARYSHPQAHEQSCTSVAIMAALAELGLIAASRVGSGLEIQIHGMLKRDPTPGSGQEEILPHAAVGYLTKMGAQASVYQDKARTAPPPPMNFANRNYIYTGIAIRVWK